MSHQRVFNIHGTDPFAAGLHQVLGAVDNLDKPLIIHRSDVAGFEPAILGPAMGLVWGIVVAGSYPGTAYFELAGSIAVAGSFDRLALEAFRAHHAQFDKGSRPALFCSDFVLSVGGPVAHVAFEFADSGEGRGFGHAPEMEDVEIVLVEGAHEALRRGRAADDNANGPCEFPAPGIFLEGG